MVRLPPRLRPLFPYLKPVYTALTRAVAPVTIKLGRGEYGLPAGWVATVEHAAERSGGRWLLSRQPERIVRTPPPGPGARTFAADMIEFAPRTVVAELPGGRVLGPHHAVISGRGELVHDVSFYFGTTRPREHPLYLHPFVAPPHRVPGRLGVLATRGDVNYYHFLMDVLPRLAVLAGCPQITAPRHWYVPTSLDFQRQLLDLAGVPTADRVDPGQFPHVVADTLVVPTTPSMTVVNPPWVVQWLRATLLTEPITRIPGRGLYVTRGGGANNRAVLNEDDVIAMVRARGFEVVDTAQLSVPDQITAFAQASMIVSAHGAALANLVFTGAGATVVELFPAGSVVTDYWKLACGVPGLRYRYQVGRGRRGRASRSSMLVSDIVVDLPALAAELDAIPAEQG